MMSAEHYLDKRAKAAVETWAQDTIQLKNKSFVNVEILASGQGTCFSKNQNNRKAHLNGDIDFVGRYW